MGPVTYLKCQDRAPKGDFCFNSEFKFVYGKLSIWTKFPMGKVGIWKKKTILEVEMIGK